MARHRFKRKFARIGARSYFRAKRRSNRSSSSGMKSMVKTLAIAAGYGAVREYAAKAVSPISEQPMIKQVLGNASDEVTLLGGALLLKKFGKGRFMSNEIGNAIMIVEAARIGELLRTGTMQGNATSSTGSQTVYS